MKLYFKEPIVILKFGLLLVFILPWILTQPNIFKSFDFSDTGQIGDTIGGVTAPFLSLIGSYLVYLALKAQISANELLQKQIDNEREENQISKLYSYLNESISSFTFTSFPEDKLGNIEKLNSIEKKGGEALHELLDQIYCREYHGNEIELMQNQSVSELYSILNILNLLLEKISHDKTGTSEIIKTLAIHQFNYRIATRIRDISNIDLEQHDCGACGCKHGMPHQLKEIIVSIRVKI
jgi:hypothetical protein